MKSGRGPSWAGYAALWLAMMAARQDFWFAADARLVAGLLPAGLAYQAAFSLLAAGVMWALVRFAWPEELDRLEHEAEGPGAPHRH